MTTFLNKVPPPKILAKDLHDVERWPKVASSKVFVLHAIQLIGQRMYGPKWTGDELFVSVWPISPLSEFENALAADLKAAQGMAFNERLKHLHTKILPGGKYPDSETDHDIMKAQLIQQCHSASDAPRPANVMKAESDWSANKHAMDRLKQVVTWLGDVCRNGTVRTFYKVTDWQQIATLSAHKWNCVQDLEYWYPKAGAEISVQNGNFTVKKAVHFFLDSVGLEAAMAALAHAPVEIPVARLDLLSPDLRLAVSVALELALFEVNAPGNKRIKQRIGESAKLAGREISVRKIEDMASVMRWPDESKASRSKK